MNGHLFVIYGSTSSGTGKTEIVNRAMEHLWKATRIVTCTTRPPRQGEVDGAHYHFLTKEEFQKGIDIGDFVEFDQHYDNWYGTRRSDIASALRTHAVVFLITDLNGAKTHRAALPHATFVAIAADPNEVIERMRRRGDSTRSIASRQSNMADEAALFREIGADHIVLNPNGELERATNEFLCIVVRRISRATLPE